jgi:hypothetical protein
MWKKIHGLLRACLTLQKKENKYISLTFSIQINESCGWFKLNRWQLA